MAFVPSQPATTVREGGASAPGTSRDGCLVVDRTHLGRRASGIERITRELFSADALAPLPVSGWEARGTRLSMMVEQMLRMPLAAATRPRSVWIFSGYPPSPAFALAPERAVLYVHDLFLLTRREELNRAAKLYMAPPFRLALARLRYFLVNSEATGEALRPWLKPGATVLPYRPAIRNVFALSPSARAGEVEPLVVGAMGTVEPRKNLLAAARLCAALGRALDRPVELHVVGRRGWGPDADALAQLPHVKLLGFLDDADAKRAIARFDLFASTSHDEGLGLPLLEMQFAGLLVVAPDKPVFREVLGSSGLLVDVEDAGGVASRIAAELSRPDWRARAAIKAADNIARWNRQAEGDRAAVIDFLAARLAAVSGGSGR